VTGNISIRISLPPPMSDRIKPSGSNGVGIINADSYCAAAAVINISDTTTPSDRITARPGVTQQLSALMSFFFFQLKKENIILKGISSSLRSIKCGSPETGGIVIQGWRLLSVRTHYGGD
jgi:hypothetical protein